MNYPMSASFRSWLTGQPLAPRLPRLQAITVHCRGCGRVASLPYADETRASVLVNEIRDWEVSPRGIVCPECVTVRDGQT